MFYFPCKIVSSLTFFLFVKTSAIILQGYNERCELYDETSSCDDSVGLMCVNTGVKGYRCKCPNDSQFATIYDSKRHKCVGKALNSCVRSNAVQFQTTNLNDTLCVENAECNTSLYYLPICLCKKGYFETDEGSCAPVSKYGEDCDDDGAICDLKSGMSCSPTTGKCTCKNEEGHHQFYDHRLEKCVTHVNGNCTSDNDCVPFAYCSRAKKVSIRRKRRSIIFGREQEDLSNSPLPPLLLSNPFTASSENAGKCLCRPGYSSTKDGFCMPSYGALCNPRSVSQDVGNQSEICNPDQYLECLENEEEYRCQCRNPMNERWDAKFGKCVAIPGKRCRLSSSYASCEEGSECVKGVCTCQNRTSLTPTGQCKKDFNEPCKPGECNTFRGLMCHGKTQSCLCIDSYLKYDRKRGACLAEVNSPCGHVTSPNIGGSMRINKSESYVPFIECEDGSVCSPVINERDAITATGGNRNVGYFCKAK